MERILVVEDDKFFRTMLADLLQADGYVVDAVSSCERAMQALKKQNYQLVVTDLILPDRSGLELLTRVKQRDTTTEVIIVTGHANVESAITALKNGARDYLVKPFNHEEFKHSVALAMEQRRLIDENQELKELLGVYQVGQNIANCLEIERLSGLIMDALQKEVGLSRGIALFLNEERQLELREVRGFTPEQGETLATHLHQVVQQQSMVSCRQLAVPLPLPAELAEVASLEEAQVLQIASRVNLQGIVIFFPEPGATLLPIARLASLNFLLDQAALAIENAARYATVKNLLYIDELTGLNNYRYLEIALEREIKRADRNNSSVVVIFLDLDLFKNVNDRHGHLVGSRVLREVGVLLKQSVREVDTVIRYGGDEYTIILGETTAPGAAIVGERIRSSIEGNRFLSDDGFEITLTASLGYACYPDDTTSKQELLEMADRAMYRGKSGGKNIVSPFTNSSS